jgi:hypothetical protein
MQRYVAEDGDRGHLMIGNFHSGIFLVFYFHEPIMNVEISTKYHFATDFLETRNVAASNLDSYILFSCKQIFKF